MASLDPVLKMTTPDWTEEETEQFFLKVVKDEIISGRQQNDGRNYRIFRKVFPEEFSSHYFTRIAAYALYTI